MQLKGYCQPATCWQYLHDVSSSLEAVHSTGKSHGNISLAHVIVKGRHFELADNFGNTPKESDIWSLAASAMELMLGSPIFNGKGEDAVNSRTPIPSLASNDAHTLSELLCRCLSPSKSQRPSAAEIKDVAAKELKIAAGKHREVRMPKEVAGETEVHEIERKWPDSMMSINLKFLITLLLAFASWQSINAQTLEEAGEKELLRMRGSVLLLRDNTKENWDRAQDEISDQLNTFTLMDKLRDSVNDCKPISDRVKRLRINVIIGELKEGRRVQNSSKELLGGEDSRFSYSIFEKCIKKKATATYTIAGHSGKQVFVVIPYRAGNPYSCTLSVGNGEQLEPDNVDKEGISYFFIDTAAGPAPGEDITLKIYNGKNDNASFVIMNHNYKDK